MPSTVKLACRQLHHGNPPCFVPPQRVLTYHTEIICSTSIERIVSGRNAALMQIEALIHQFDEISTLTSSIGGGMAKEWAMRPGHRYDCWFTEKTETAMKAITRNIE